LSSSPAPPAEPLPPLEEERLAERAQHAVRLVRAGVLEGWEALELVVLPGCGLEDLQVQAQTRELLSRFTL
jgi:hypothetical protein